MLWGVPTFLARGDLIHMRSECLMVITFPLIVSIFTGVELARFIPSTVALMVSSEGSGIVTE